MKLDEGASKAENAEARSAGTATAAGAAAGRAAFLRKFGICRLCFRQLALNGEIPGRDQGELVRQDGVVEE